MMGEFIYWLLIIMVILLGSAFVYFAGWHILESIAPDAVEKYNLKFILKDIKHYFGFLLEDGYKIREAHSYKDFGNWIVQLESQDCIIVIALDRSEIQLSFMPEKTDSRYQISIESMIYYLTKGEIFIGYFDGNLASGKEKQLERYANLLRKYHDQIISFVGGDYVKSKDAWNRTEKKYHELLREDYSRKFTKMG